MRNKLRLEEGLLDLSKITLTEWVGICGALLAATHVVVDSLKSISRKIKRRRERAKIKTDLNFLRKVDKRTKEIHPIVVVLLANLGAERIALKSLDYRGVAENGLETTGCMGWYEQPEEIIGIRHRLLPVVLESGHTTDLPMVEIGVIIRIKNLKIWLTDFDGHRYYLDENDIAKVKHDVEQFLLEKKDKG